MRKLEYILLGMTALAAAPAEAASLQVTPILVDVAADTAAATTVTLKNGSNKPVNTQLRVFRWTQVNGQDQYAETTDVAVSPPMVTMRPNGEYVIRVVRTNRAPIRGEESYRLVADELPDPEAKKAGTINLLVRHSVPVFFRSTAATQPNVTWNIAKRGGRIVVEGHNSGDRRVRVARLKADDGAGNTLNYGDGLNGYVLGKSSATFASRAAAKGFAGGSAKISLTSEAGPVSATASVK
jgi:fimbrial chaperone protein